MNIKALAMVLIRVTAIYFLVEGIGYAAKSVQAMIPIHLQQEPYSWLVLAAMLLPGAVYLAAGFLLWHSAEPVGRRLGAQDGSAASTRTSGLDAASLMRAGLFVSGLVLAAAAVPELMRSAAQLVLTAEIRTGDYALMRARLWTDAGASLIKLALGLLLAAGARRRSDQLE